MHAVFAELQKGKGVYEDVFQDNEKVATESYTRKLKDVVLNSSNHRKKDKTDL